MEKIVLPLFVMSHVEQKEKPEPLDMLYFGIQLLCYGLSVV